MLLGRERLQECGIESLSLGSEAGYHKAKAGLPAVNETIETAATWTSNVA
jgi:hypothetical protein